jgi:hypothetical protein
MLKESKLFRAFGLIALVFILQACSCYGVDLNRYLGGTDNQAPTSSMNCSNIHLSSPRGGLPNGLVTVYWDVLEGATKYRVNLYSGGVQIGTWEVFAPATNLQANVSEAAVGGSNPLELELIASDAYGYTCRDSVVQNREAAPAQAAPIVAPSATPTCIEKPTASYC